MIQVHLILYIEVMSFYKKFIIFEKTNHSKRFLLYTHFTYTNMELFKFQSRFFRSKLISIVSSKLKLLCARWFIFANRVNAHMCFLISFGHFFFLLSRFSNRHKFFVYIYKERESSFIWWLSEKSNLTEARWIHQSRSHQLFRRVVRIS